MAHDKNGSTGYAKSNGARLRFTEAPPSMQELLTLGEKAARLLNDPIYCVAHKSAIQEIQDEILHTRPEEKNRREGLYMELQALSRGVRRLNAMLNEAQQLNMQLQQREAAAQQAQEHQYGEAV